ncbi:MAG: alanine--tRNA ligase [Nitrospirae bacterium]|nr:MAG: alanine--tRNA ligase [Nitrospirota bacterium]
MAGKSADELRQSFLRYFAQHGHTIVPSAPLIPQADPTLLFTNAGMNQFKRVFLGEESRPYTRAASVQKCLRAGGKHNDLENVGYTRRHHTFFEMLGNFSFGDYFKREAITYGWEYLTAVLALPAEQLWVTVYTHDDEAYTLWRDYIGLPTSRLVRMGEKDNFWQMGDTGPCGPCSEILIDQGEAMGCGRSSCAVGCDCDRYLEIWNLVFMQYDRDATGTLHPLPKPSIDTGMGLERLAAVVQGVPSNYETDLFLPLLTAIGNRTQHKYGRDAQVDRSMRVIADHLRAMTFLIADGILPSNEGRGYVLRRILRRASRHGRLLGIQDAFLHELVEQVVTMMEQVYPELRQAIPVIKQAVYGEEERFLSTLDQGLPLLQTLIEDTRKEKQTSLNGEQVFKLYDTYGFPLDLIEEAAREQGFSVDLAGFQRALDTQRERARKSAAFTAERESPLIADLSHRFGATVFVGYQTLEVESEILAILQGDRLVQEAEAGAEVELVLERTPFYPEGGGQVGDQGILTGPEGHVVIQDTKKVGRDLVLHKGKVQTGHIRVGERVYARVNPLLRHDAARNHTATHLVHAALRDILGPHVKQYGSLVAPNRLRFDFSHFKPLSSKEIEDIEALVNYHVREDTPVQTEVMPLHDAIQSGALAFFGDKYGDQVRVVEIGSFSKELCGGTHCRHTGEIGVFRIVSEGGIAAGVRRLEALTGGGALTHIQRLEADIRMLAELLKTTPNELVPKTRKILSLLKEKERELEHVKVQLVHQESGQKGHAQVRNIDGVPVHVQQVDGLTIQELRLLADTIRNKLSRGVIALGSSKEGKAFLLVVVTKDLAQHIKAVELVQLMAKEVGGSGGGRPEMAQAGGKQPERLALALEKVFPFVEACVSKRT